MLSKEKQEVLRYYNLGLEAYRQRKWDEAIEAFKKCLEVDPKDGPSQLYLQRSEDLKENPPAENWDGVFTMTTK
jgi:adenylate cyclase